MDSVVVKLCNTYKKWKKSLDWSLCTLTEQQSQCKRQKRSCRLPRPINLSFVVIAVVDVLCALVLQSIHHHSLDDDDDLLSFLAELAHAFKLDATGRQTDREREKERGREREREWKRTTKESSVREGWSSFPNCKNNRTTMFLSFASSFLSSLFSSAYRRRHRRRRTRQHVNLFLFEKRCQISSSSSQR